MLLRLALRTLRLFASGQPDDAREYALDGARRLAAELDAHGTAAFAAPELALERAAWDAYYDAVDAVEQDDDLAAAAASILDACRVSA